MKKVGSIVAVMVLVLVFGLAGVLAVPASAQDGAGPNLPMNCDQWVPYCCGCDCQSGSAWCYVGAPLTTFCKTIWGGCISSANHKCCQDFPLF